MMARGIHAKALPSQLNRLLGGLRAKSDLVTLERRGRVGVLRLNDPKRLNPMTAAMGKALQGAVCTCALTDLSVHASYG